MQKVRVSGLLDESDDIAVGVPLPPRATVSLTLFSRFSIQKARNAARYSDEVLHLGTYPPLGGLQSMMEPSATVADPEENVCPC